MTEWHAKRYSAVGALWLATTMLLPACKTASHPPAKLPPSQGRTDEQPSFADIKAKSRRESHSPEATRWEQVNASQMSAPISGVTQSCRATTLEGTDVGFTVLVRLQSDGHVSQTLVSPVNPFSTCVRSAFMGLTFPGAPWEGYWLEIEMAAVK